MHYLSAALLLLLSACTTAYVPERAAAEPPPPPVENVRTDRKLLRSADIELTVQQPDSALHQLLRLVDTLNGYVSQTSTEGATLRVPAAHFDRTLESIAALGRVTEQRLTGRDVTEAYRDLGVRLNNAERSRQRYLELLARANTVAEALLVEKELERLAETIDLLKGRRQLLDNQEAFATVRVRLREQVKPGPLGYVAKGVYAVVRWLFVRN